MIAEGTLVKYYDNGWRVAYFEKQEPPLRPKVAVLIPLVLGKRRIRVDINDVLPCDRRGEVLNSSA